MKHRIEHISVAIAIVLISGGTALSQESVDVLNTRAQNYFEKREYNKAITLWFDALDKDPENEKIQQKIELVYEIKQRKDLAYQRSRLAYRIARRKLQQSEDKIVEDGINIGENSIENYVTAYKIDPNDFEVREFLDDIKKLEAEIKAARERIRLSRAKRAKIKQLRLVARREMESDNPDYEKTLDIWEEVLDYVPRDSEALEGKRTCELAIENRMKYEKIRNLMRAGRKKFAEKDYRQARFDFTQVLKIDPRNRDADDFIEKIDEIIEEKTMRAQRMRQAEEFYVSGIVNVRRNNYDQAEDDFESALALFNNYKDARQRLENLGRLRKEYEARKRAQRLEKIYQTFQDGMLAYSAGKYKDAINYFVTTLSLDPKNRQAEEYLGRAREAQRKVEEERVDDNSPYFDIVQSLVLSGKSLFRKGQYAESKKQWDRILKLFPQNRIAKEWIIKCDLRLDPGSRDVLVGRKLAEGKELLRKNKYRDAYRLFDVIQSIVPDYPGIRELLARAERGMRLPAGKEDVEPADRAEIARRYGAGMRLYQQGGRDNIRKALALFRWVVNKDPNNAKAAIVVNKIEAQLRVGGGEQQERRLTQKQKLLVNKYYYRGINYYSNNKFREAIREWRKVLAIDPQNVKARNNIRKFSCFLDVKRR